MLAKGLLWFAPYRRYPFKRQLTVIAIVALASFISSVIVLAIPSFLRAISRVWHAFATPPRKIEATTGAVIVAVVLAGLWLHHKQTTRVVESSEVDLVQQYEQQTSAAQNVQWDDENTPSQSTQASSPLSDFAAAPTTTRDKDASGSQSVDSVPLDELAKVQSSRNFQGSGHPRPATYTSLPTGTRIREDNRTSGHGELTVKNGTSEDAVVRLYDPHTDQTVRWFFVQANSSAHITQIPQGVYRLAFTTGLNWVEAKDSFTWRPSYSEFERSLNFQEESDSEGINYHAISVTLNPVALGNVRTKPITREEFMKGHQHMTFHR